MTMVLGAYRKPPRSSWRGQPTSKEGKRRMGKYCPRKDGGSSRADDQASEPGKGTKTKS